MARINNDHTQTFEAGEFYFQQRNAGYADNDGKWVVSLMPEVYWSNVGVLRQRRPGKLVGVFATLGIAVDAAREAGRMPIVDEMVR